MSRDDLLADLQTEAAARPAAPPTPPREVPTGTPRLTPAFDVGLTPLRWSLPKMGPAAAGVGLAVRVGPVQISLGVR